MVEIHKTLTVLVVDLDITVAVQVVTKNHLTWVAVAAQVVVAVRHRLRHKTGLREVAARIKHPIDLIDPAVGLLIQDQKEEGLANRQAEGGRMVVTTEQAAQGHRHRPKEEPVPSL